MTELVQEPFTKNGDGKQNAIVDEYRGIVESLLRDLEMCKNEQTRLRAESESLRRESRAAAEIARECFSRANIEKCSQSEDNREFVGNLEMRISMIEKEKESVFQLCQMALRTVETLEDELKATRQDDRAKKYYEERVKSLEETYSKAIDALEAKLVQAKNNFEKHQTIWESNKERLENLIRERNELERKLSNVGDEARLTQEANCVTIEALKSELEGLRKELERDRAVKTELQERLIQARRFTEKVVAKDEESRSKISEAIELVEAAVNDKDLALRKEARALKEKENLESRLNSVVEEYTTRLNAQLVSAQQSFQKKNDEFIREIKELKLELREKATLLDRIQREKALLEEELDRLRRTSEDSLERSTANMCQLQDKLQEVHSRMERCEEMYRVKYEEKIRLAEERVTELEARLVASDERCRMCRSRTSADSEEQATKANERLRESSERISSLETRLARALEDKENIGCELGSLRAKYDREIATRDEERRSQESRIRQLHDHLENANDHLSRANARATLLTTQVENLRHEPCNRPSLSHLGASEAQVSCAELTLKLKMLQEKFDCRTKELSQHVETHQRLCRSWKEEAKSLANKFQIRSKEFRARMGVLRNENEELRRELLACQRRLQQQQQHSHCVLQVPQRNDLGDEPS